MSNSSQHEQEPAIGLFRPLKVGPRVMPNRIVFGAHLTNFGKGQLFGDRHLAYYSARAAGGVGMIVTEALTVHPHDYPYEHVPFGHLEEIVPSLARLAEAVRGAHSRRPPLLLAQLNHTGGQCAGRLLRQSPWAPSPVPDVASRRIPREMLPGEIEEVIAGFAAAAQHAALAGLDGVELNAGQHSLLRQFLSPLTNHRGDEWGGNLENRSRMLERVVLAVRGRVGAEQVLGVKLCGDELAPWGGLTPEDAAQAALRLAALGAVDYISIQIAGPYAVHLTDPGMPTPEGYGLAQAASIRAALRRGGANTCPVFAEGRIETLQTAESAINGAAASGTTEPEGQVDAAVMTRALISDPDLPEKWRAAPSQNGEAKGAGGAMEFAEELEPPRPHIGMMRYFTVRGDWNRPLGDLINPRAGREALLPRVERLQAPASALVIGAGPAGMEAAATLARQGRKVRLVESGPNLGGIPRVLAEQIPARAEFAKLVDYYEALLKKLAVEVETSHPVTALEPWMKDYEIIFLAVGAETQAVPSPAGKPHKPAGPPRFCVRALLGVPSSGPRSAEALPPLEPLPRPEQGCAVVVDGEYGFRMAAAVEWLLEKHYAVQVVSDDFFVGRGLVESGDMAWFARVAGQGVLFHPRTVVPKGEGVPAGGTLVCADRFSGKERNLNAVALVVEAVPDVPAEGLYEVLRSSHPRVVRIGDARAPRLMGEAILDAHRSVLLEG